MTLRPSLFCAFAGLAPAIDAAATAAWPFFALKRGFVGMTVGLLAVAATPGAAAAAVVVALAAGVVATAAAGSAAVAVAAAAAAGLLTAAVAIAAG